MFRYRSISGLLVIIILLGLCACTPASPDTPSTESPSKEQTQPTTEATEPTTEPTEPPATDSSETLPSVELETREGFIPILMGDYPNIVVGPDAVTDEPETIRVSYTVWDLEHGGLTDEIPWYQQTLISWVEANIAFWAGETRTVTWSETTSLVQGISVDEASAYETYYGSAVLVTFGYGNHTLYWIQPDGTRTEILQPEAPSDLCDGMGYHLIDYPAYAWSDGETVFITYLATQDVETNMVYTTYPFDSPESAQWQVSPAPFMQASDLTTNRTYAYHQGKLYAGSLKGIVELDTVSGEIIVLDETNLFRDVFNIYPNTRWNNDVAECQMYVVGCWNGTLIFEIPLWTDEAEGKKYHIFYTAVKDGQIQGVMERSDWGLFTFYDKDLNVLGTDDRYQLTLEPYCVKFPLAG